jgi:hypothetical protein
MSGDHTPRHIEARMLEGLRDVTRLATDLGVENVFAVELFMAQQSVQDAVQSKSRQRTDRAVTEIRDLAMRITRTTTGRSAIRRYAPAGSDARRPTRRE